jgi:hypothetical protein
VGRLPHVVFALSVFCRHMLSEPVGIRSTDSGIPSSNIHHASPLDSSGKKSSFPNWSPYK